MAELVGKIVYRTFSSNPDYFVLCEKGVVKVLQEGTESDYSIGEFLVAEGDYGAGGFGAESLELLESEREEAEKRKTEALLKKFCVPREPKLFVDDGLMRKMVPVFKEAALFLQKKLFELTPVLIRFHEDADGVTSGLLVMNAVTDFVKEKGIPYPPNFLKSKQSSSAIYELKEAREDGDDAADYAKPPLLVLLDHGVNAESVHALKEAKRHGFQILAIDHHPFAEEAVSMVDCFVSCRSFEGSSSHTAGLLSFEVASAVAGKADEQLVKYSLQGDKSSFAKGFHEEPIVLDYITSYYESLDKYAKLLADKDRVHMLYRKALALEESMKQKLKAHVEEVKAGGGRVLLLNLSPLGKRKYPTKGDCVQLVQLEHEHEKTPVVTVGFDSQRVIFRLNAAAAEKLKANELIEFFKRERPEAVESGGGHERAASMRVRKGKSLVAEVRKLVIEKLEAS